MRLKKQNYDWANLIFTNKLDSKMYGYFDTGDGKKRYWLTNHTIGGMSWDNLRNNKTFYI